MAYACTKHDHLSATAAREAQRWSTATSQCFMIVVFLYNQTVPHRLLGAAACDFGRHCRCFMHSPTNLLARSRQLAI